MFLGYELRNVEGMKSQLMTALSIVGVLGTATTAMAVNTDALANFDPGAIGTATDTLLPGTPVPADPTVPIATPAPTEPSTTPTPVDPTAPTPVDPSAPQSGVTTPGGTSGSSPVVQNPQAAPVNGTTGGSGSRVEPASGAVVNDDEEDDHDEDEDEDHEEDHEEEDDD